MSASGDPTDPDTFISGAGSLREAFATGGFFRIRWFALFGTLIGGTILAVFEGVTSYILAFGRIVTMIYESVTMVTVALINALVGAGGAFPIAWASARADIAASGIAAFALAAIVAGAVSYIYSWGVSQFVE